MNLIRFLSSGSRSLSKGPRPMGRYQLPVGRVMPDFSSPRNPFNKSNKDLSPPQEASSSAACVTARAASTQAAPPSPALSAPSSSGRGTGLVARISGAVATGLSRIKSAGGAGLDVGRRLGQGAGAGLQRLRLLRLRRRSPFARSGSAPSQGPVQGELSLDHVRVVRNDLTETDYEVVCADTATASPVKRVPQTINLSTPPRPLGRLAERLFNQKVQ